MPEFNQNCTACDRLARHLKQVRADYPDYHARPVPPFGASPPRLLIVGLAPGLHGANRSGRPFTGDHAGILLYQTLYKYGFADRPVSERADDGLRLLNCRITNAVKCLPPQNKPTPAEVRTCNRYLVTELRDLAPGAVIVALGTIAHQAVCRALDGKLKDTPFKHGKHYVLPGDLYLLDSYHCSRYNTQTRRLTPAMFEQVFRQAHKLLFA